MDPDPDHYLLFNIIFSLHSTVPVLVLNTGVHITGTGTKLKFKFNDPEREKKILEFLFKCFGSRSGSISIRKVGSRSVSNRSGSATLSRKHCLTTIKPVLTPLKPDLVFTADSTKPLWIRPQVWRTRPGSSYRSRSHLKRSRGRIHRGFV